MKTHTYTQKVSGHFQTTNMYMNVMNVMNVVEYFPSYLTLTSNRLARQKQVGMRLVGSLRESISKPSDVEPGPQPC